jgi:glycosyltransferase involved in cell wall biosynthesis
MRILYAINSTEIGGAEKVFGDLAVSLRARGHRCSILVPAENRGRTAQFPDSWYDEVHELSLAAFSRGGGLLGEVLKGYDLVHLALLPAPYRRGFQAAGCRLVHTVHSIAVWSLSYACGFNQGEIVSALTTGDRSTAAYIRGIYPGLKIRAIPNGIDVNRYTFRPVASDGIAPLAGRRSVTERAVVGTLSRVSPYAKNLEMFARVAGRVQSAARALGRNIPIFRVIGGWRPEHAPLADRLRKIARDAGGEIEITGFVGLDEIPRRLAELDLFLLTSSSEGSPLAILEAFATGLPVVATAVGEVPELFLGSHAPHGTLVAADDDQEMALAVEQYLERPDLAAAHGLAARGYVQARHALADMVDEYEQLYREILGQ